MKSMFTGILISLFLFTLNAHGQNKELTVKDSITIFYDALFEKLESNYLKRNEVNWDTVKDYTLKEALTSESFYKSLSITSKLLDTIKCNHCELFTEKGSFKSTLNKPLYADDFSKEFALRLDEKSAFDFDVKRINEHTGYINMPGMLLINLPKDSLNLKTQKMYDKISQLKTKENIDNWVIDLRFNIGGNAYVMLAALYDFLGNNIAYKSIDSEGKQISSTELLNGELFSNKSSKVKVNVSSQPDLKTPVALIIGKMTGSAGEDVALAFKDRDNVVLIGQPTYGFLTGNDMFELPFNIRIALTLSYIVDVNNEYHEYIKPDIEVLKKDNFKDLSKDGNIIKAVEYFKTKKQ